MSVGEGRVEGAGPGDELPDGVVPLRVQPKGPGGCGLTGCLYGMVGLFALLLLALLSIALFRVWQVPAVVP